MLMLPNIMMVSILNLNTLLLIALLNVLPLLGTSALLFKIDLKRAFRNLRH